MTQIYANKFREYREFRVSAVNMPVKFGYGGAFLEDVEAVAPVGTVRRSQVHHTQAHTAEPGRCLGNRRVAGGVRIRGKDDGSCLGR
jgi:hypothetical protein